MVHLKIAVLFGSFNPLTNAHVSALKTAVRELGADKGLFVATNGQYLRRKAVKIGDPFCLTEEERQEAIEKVCENEPELSFWGFELGGINPSRYKTLCRIEKQYPEAELYEIQGADKVRTIARSRFAPEYLAKIRFAIFTRNDIDLEPLFDSTPLLAEHRDSFVMMPALDKTGSISSTLVRRLFYLGEDFSAFVPPATVEILSRHKPTDFSISYGERMKILLKSGRFGRMRACYQVYLDNNELFLDWKASNKSTLFGDYRKFLDNTRLYSEPFSVADKDANYPTTQVGCINADCVDVARRLQTIGYNPAILNLASARHPGGGYHQGYAAQEESLCHSSNLSQSLYQFGNTKYKHIRESGVPHRLDGYPLDLNFGGIYTPDVTFFRYNRSNFFELREEPFKCDVITVAALSFTGRTDFSGATELDYRAEDGGFTPEGEAIMLNKIRTIFRLGVEAGKDSLVLGAFGCGAYKLPSAEVARLFRQVMNEPEFAGKFRLLVFAILERTAKPCEADGKFAPFYKEFGSFEFSRN